MSDRDVTSEAEALALATRIAARTGLELLPVQGRERILNHGSLTRMRMRGRLAGLPIDHELRFVDAGPASELTAEVDVQLSRNWVDMLAVGRSMPGAVLRPEPFSHDLAAEISLRCEDEEWLAELLSGEVAALLIAANYSGYRPRLDDQRLHFSAGALDPTGAEKLLRHASRLGVLLEARRSEIRKPRRESELAAALELVRKGIDGRFDRDAMVLEIRRVEGTLTLAIMHHAYGDWSSAIELLFERPLPVKLSIAPVRAFYESWFRPDIRTGDGSFDRAFSVRGEPEDRVVQLLGEPTRGALEALVKLGKDVLLTQDGINLQLPGVILDAERLHRLLDSVFALAEALLAHASGPRAYR